MSFMTQALARCPARKLAESLGSFIAVAACVVSTAATAQTTVPNPWKSDRPVTIVVPFATGGSVDLLGRLLAKHITTVTGQSTVVENSAGADGLIGTRRVIDAPPDGYTLVLQITGIQIAKYMPGLRGIDPLPRLDPVTNVLETPQVLMTNLNVPQNLKDLAEYCRKAAQPCSLGISESTARIYSQRLAAELGIPNLIVATYRGTAPSVIDVVGGQLTMVLTTYAGAVSHFQSGKVGIATVFDSKRLPQLPQVESVAEAGYPQLRAVTWFGLFAPKGTPPAQLAAISKVMQSARDNPEFQQRISSLGAVLVLDNPSEFAATIKRGEENWRSLVAKYPIQ